ncbi:hypothetical protein QAD02_010242 [Eretmocerus hayati]|uniref:Uncharacterized protein n=2 Tax=Eretmocerus hayati TaxID=131215 RepID=A0ACC2NCB2_9HYME|nr:hypothetical protein QAD02_010241 [Eretmocerus hayati]KAJ8668579.1 hypothetical protein QAD02_010242 [Eretmocerus hayati]
MLEYSLPELLAICGSVLLITLLLMDLLDSSCILSSLDCPSSAQPGPFVYSESGGPGTWRCTYPEANGCEQSPINVACRSATVLTPSDPLRWKGYAEEPVSASIVNDGNTVVLFGFWTCPSRPTLQGGPLKGCYDFHSVVFRWGPSDHDGSEHSLDYVRYPLELQVVHTKRGVCDPKPKLKDALVIVSYFFQITSADNPYMDMVVTNLWRVSSPGAHAHVAPFPLEWLFPCFERKFYTYHGSLTYPPCSETVVWILQPETISVSSKQVAEFRKVCSVEGPIVSNTRPVQKLHDRQIFYYA